MSHTWKRCYWAEEKQLCRVPEVKALQPRLLPGKAIGAALTLHRESSSSGRGQGTPGCVTQGTEIMLG